MTLDLSNAAVAFLFFTGFGLWTLFVAWAFCDKGRVTAPIVSLVTAIGFILSGLIALFIVITNALITP